MYDDYDVVYKSNINEFLIYYIILGIIVVLLIGLIFISLSKVFKKANRSGISAFIPFYNIYVLVEIANLPKIYFALSLIPIVNIYFLAKINMELAKLFKEDTIFGIGMTFLPFIYYTILAFNDNEYVGINLVAMDESNTVEKISVIDDNKQKTIEKEVNEEEDTASSNINISIGGGKYQKDYENKVDAIDESKLLYKTKQVKAERVDLSPTRGVFINGEMLKEEEPVVEKTEEPTVFSVPFINEKQVEIPQEPVKKIPVDVVPTDVDLLKSSYTEPTKIDTCPNCGTRINPNDKICMICGHPLQ